MYRPEKNPSGDGGGRSVLNKKKKKIPRNQKKNHNKTKGTMLGVEVYFQLEEKNKTKKKILKSYLFSFCSTPCFCPK